MELAGHIIGFLAVATFFVSYQIYDKKKLLLVQTLATGLLCVQYLLIGAYSGFALNLLGIVRNLLYCNRDKRALSGKWLPFTMAGAMAVVSLFSWDGPHSLLIMAGLMINAVCLALYDSQNLRKSILITCPLVLAYNLVEGSYSGLVSESISMISALIGILRFRKTQKAENTKN